jgi:hypothetical protein
MRFMSYQRKTGDQFFPELLVVRSISLSIDVFTQNTEKYLELQGFRTLSIVRYSRNSPHLRTETDPDSETPSPEDGNRSRFRNWICFRLQVSGVSRIQDDGQSPKTQ